MAKFLTTVGTSFYIEQIIINSTDSLTLVTPYLKLSQNLLERLSDAEREGARITLIYGKSELAQQEKNKLYSLKNIRIYFCQNLHAKCYHNEDLMIITSMNLYEFSERNNREMGILAEKEKDEEIFSSTLKEIESIKNASKLEKDFDNQEVKSQEVTFQIDPNYPEIYNFHLPTLSIALKNKYPDREVEFDESIKIKGFPYAGVDLEVDGRIDFVFDQSLNYDRIKSRNMGVVDADLPRIRFYWNHYKLNIYTEKNYEPELSSAGLEEKVNKFMQIIGAVHDRLKI
jgi:hypothetical protein